MKKTAEKHGLVCLLHEKPFAGVNGSGKHDNWSLNTDTGKISSNPAARPAKTPSFWCFSPPLSRVWTNTRIGFAAPWPLPATTTAWGANEAPPAILSVFLGDELEAVVESIINGTNYTDLEKSVMRIGVDVLPSISKDTTDRNRTSPLAFTGNKFEFRMLGSSQSVSGPNIALNTIMAEELKWFADQLEQSTDFDADLQKLICQALTEHRRIIFNGNGYDESWIQEAERRGGSPTSAPRQNACLRTSLRKT